MTAEQRQKAIAIVSNYKRQHAMVPVDLVFFEKEGWTNYYNQAGVVTGGHRGYEKVIGIHVIH